MKDGIHPETEANPCCGTCHYYNEEIVDGIQFCDKKEAYVNKKRAVCYRYKEKGNEMEDLIIPSTICLSDEELSATNWLLDIIQKNKIAVCDAEEHVCTLLKSLAELEKLRRERELANSDSVNGNTKES